MKIELACDPPFPLDIIVRTPQNMQWRLAEGESFLREITTKGKVLYENTGRYFCHKCRSHGNALELWAAVHKLRVYEAALDLCQALGREVPWVNRW